MVPEVRRQGVGAAITRAALLFARDLGTRYALLNSTDMGESLYSHLGFHSLACGQTWWLHQEVLQAPPLPQHHVLFWEAAGRGDIELLSATGSLLRTAELDAKTAAGITALQLAVRTSQPRSVEWLLERGATLDILSAWDLGWKDRIPALQSKSPKVVDWRSGRWRLTPLHEAVLRDDLELTRLILSGDRDLNAQDTEFHSTPLGWARHLGRQEIAALIEGQGANAGPEGRG